MNRSEDRRLPVEVVAWSAVGDPSLAHERAAVDSLIAVFERDWPLHRIVNPVSQEVPLPQQMQAFRARWTSDAPPASYQLHAGAEVIADAQAGHLMDLTSDFEQWGLFDGMPPGMVEAVSLAGHAYGVPTGVHRLLWWCNEHIVDEYGARERPTNVSDLIGHLAALRSAGLEYPLAAAAPWSQLELLEAVLLSELGPDHLAATWTCGHCWSHERVRPALCAYRDLLSYSNPDRDMLSWSDAASLVAESKAAYLFMGDWVRSCLPPHTCSHQPFPGTEESFVWAGDAFVVTGRTPSAAAHGWAGTVASPEGQLSFASRKGGIPVRTDLSSTSFSSYQRSTMREFQQLRLVPSCAHGSASTPGISMAATAAVARFSISRDVETLQSEMAEALGSPSVACRV